MWGATASASAALTLALPNTGRFTFYQYFWQQPLQLEDSIQLGNTALGEVGMTFSVSKQMREQDPLRRMISDVAGRLLNDESLTRRERVVVEEILDGTWRVASDGPFVSSGKEKQSQPSATSSKLGLGVLRSYREVLSKMFERAIVRARTMDEADVERPINRDILNHVLAAILGVLTGVLLIAAVAAILR